MEHLFFNICSIAELRRYLSQDTVEIIVHAYITSLFDYSNVIYYGLLKCLINRFQLVQNSAARLVTLTRKLEQTTPILKAYTDPQYASGLSLI